MNISEVLPSPPGSLATGSDYYSRAARTAFHRIRRGHHGSVCFEVPCPSLGGLPKKWEFETPSSLAETVLEYLPAQTSALIADLRVKASGEINFTTRRHLQWQRSRGNLLCSDCGQFYAGERGLQDHQRRKHGKAVMDALDAVDISRLQLIPVSLPRNIPLDSLAVSSARSRADQKQLAAKAGVELDDLLMAAKDGDLQRLQKLVVNGWDPRLSSDRHGSNALLWAAGSGHLEICRFLVDACGFDVTCAQAKGRRNALHWAARNGHTEICRWLVEQKGLAPNEPTVDGTVALHWAIWQCHDPVCDWLIKEAGADLHVKNAYGCNASQWAALAGSVKMCEWLRKEGLDLFVLNSNGHSAIHKAAVKGHLEVCKWLLDVAGLGPGQLKPDSDGNTPSRMARCGGFELLAKWLEEREQSSPD